MTIKGRWPFKASLIILLTPGASKSKVKIWHNMRDFKSNSSWSCFCLPCLLTDSLAYWTAIPSSPWTGAMFTPKHCSLGRIWHNVRDFKLNFALDAYSYYHLSSLTGTPTRLGTPKAGIGPLKAHFGYIWGHRLIPVSKEGRQHDVCCVILWP